MRIRPVVEWFAHSFVPGPGCGLCARFYQAEPAPVVGTTKCPESLCLMLALPPSGRRVPPLPRTLLLVHRSYRLMRQSRVALPYFGFWPRSRSLRRLLPAPAATGILPTLSLQILSPDAWSHTPTVPLSALACFFLGVIGLPQHSLGRLPVGIRERDFSAGYFRGCRHFFMFTPPSLLASQVVPTAANIPAGQPRLLHPGLSCFVAFARTGHAIRPNTGNWRNENFHLARFGRGRDADCSTPPAQTRAGAANAHGSYLGCLASKRQSGYGCRMGLPGAGLRGFPRKRSHVQRLR